MSAAAVSVQVHDVAMRDGVRLATEVFVADDAPARAAVLVRTPYSRAAARQSADPVTLAQQGWAVVIQDVRGRFASGGSFDPFRQEGADGADTVAWVAAQPWCDGRVVGFGGSYVGFGQWMTAAERPDGLRAIAPLWAAADGRDGKMYEGGAFRLGLLAGWACDVAFMDPTTPRRDRLIELATARRRLLATPLGDHSLRELFPPFQRWLDRDDEAFWRDMDATTHLPDLDLPVFQVTGWFDPFCEDALATYRRLRQESPGGYARDSHRLIVGPWTHGSMLPITPEFDFGPDAWPWAQGLPAVQFEWLAGVVAGVPVAGGVSVFVMGAGRWVELEQWPPPARTQRLLLSSVRGANGLDGDGRLSVVADGVGVDRFRYDPHDPVPTRGGRVLGPYLPMAGPVDQRPVEARDDVLVYTSEPLGAEVTVMGMVSARVVFASEGRSADVTVKLVDVWPDGRALNVVDSVRRVAVVPGEPVAVEVEVGSTAMCFGVGHRIRVEVSSSNFPRLDRNPSTGVPAGQAQVLEPAWQTVHHGGADPSLVRLPVTDGDLSAALS